MFGNKKLKAIMNWINENTRTIENKVERNAHSTMMMNKAII
jgi:hypothetical protein